MAEVLLFILRRLGRLLATVWLISTIIFFVIRVVPGDPALVIAGVDATAEDIAAIRARIGTDRPLPAQYLDWLWRVVRFDFGTSLTSGQPVTALIFERFGLTLSLALLGMLISLVVALPPAWSRRCIAGPSGIIWAWASPRSAWPCPASGWASCCCWPSP
jgi:peptide/nickel transport system permease protein